jgi:hypothetical protein
LDENGNNMGAVISQQFSDQGVDNPTENDVVSAIYDHLLAGNIYAQPEEDSSDEGDA